MFCHPFRAFRLAATSRLPLDVLGAGVGRGAVPYILKSTDDGGGVAAVAAAVVILDLQRRNAKRLRESSLTFANNRMR